MPHHAAPGWNRREWLGWAAASPLAAMALAPDEDVVPFEDYRPEFRVEAQPDHPRVKCFDLRRLTSRITPSGEFFAFHQTEVPLPAVDAWRLRIGGCVKHPAEFSMADLRKRTDRREAAVTLECAGNSGNPSIMNGLVSTASWTGVGLAAVLRECGIRPEAREVVFLGRDAERDPKWEAGNAEYLSPHGRSIFVQDALSPDPLLAFAMNGAPLPAEHGFPLRVILPGWYGVASVKWLARIEVIDRRYEGRHMARNYQSLHAVDTSEGALWLDTSISRTNLKSVVARITRRRLSGRFEYRIAGAAWGGAAAIRTVEVQVDGGAWRPAALDRQGGDSAWILWSIDWNDAAPGLHTVVSRAGNERGEMQPTRAELRQKLMSNREDNSQWPRLVRLEPPA